MIRPACAKASADHLEKMLKNGTNHYFLKDIMPAPYALANFFSMK